MKRGERQMWRKLENAVHAVIESDDYAKEYTARIEVGKRVIDLFGRNRINLTTFGVHEVLSRMK